MPYFTRQQAQDIVKQLAKDFNSAADLKPPSDLRLGVGLIPYQQDHGTPDKIDVDRDEIFSVSLVTGATFSDAFKASVIDRVSELAGRQAGPKDIHFWDNFKVTYH